jgi:hypothetical protein
MPARVKSSAGLAQVRDLDIFIRLALKIKKLRVKQYFRSTTKNYILNY